MASVAEFIHQIIRCECPELNPNDLIRSILSHLSGSTIYPCLDKVCGFARAEVGEWALISVADDVEERAEQLYLLLDAIQSRIFASHPEYPEEFLDTGWDKFNTAFEDYQSFAGTQIEDHYATTAQFEKFNTTCQEFVAQLAVAREALVKLLRMHKMSVFITFMLARERQLQDDTMSDDTSAEFAMAVVSLPSRPLEMIADAVAAIGRAEV